MNWIRMVYRRLVEHPLYWKGHAWIEMRSWYREGHKEPMPLMRKSIKWHKIYFNGYSL